MNTWRLALPWALWATACGASGIDPDLTPEDLVLSPRATPEPTLPEGLDLRVATFNLHGGSEATAEQIGAFLAGLELDLVGLQETPSALGQGIGARAGFSSIEGDGQMLLAKGPLSDFQRVEVLGRSYVKATLQHGGVAWSVYSAHLGWNAEGDAQCQLFREHLDADAAERLVILGDFNDEHGSTQIARLDDLLDEAGARAFVYPGQRISWPATAFDGGEGSQLIDLIFFRKAAGVIVRSYDVVNVRPVLSDHKPVWAALRFPPPGQRFDHDPYAERRNPPLPAAGPNLLRNGGAEEGLDGWQVTQDARAERQREEHGPYEGDAFFTGAPDLSASVIPVSELAQEVDLSSEAAAIEGAGAQLVVGGALTTGYGLDIAGEIRSNRVRPYDDGELIVETLGASGELLSRHTSARRDHLSYFRYGAATPIPRGAKKARLRFLSHRKANNGDSNDAIADALSLAVSTTTPERTLLGGNRLAQGDAEDVLSSDPGPGFRRHPDLVPLGVMIYPPWSWSGRGFFVAGEPLGQTPTPGAHFEAPIGLAGLEGAQEAGELTLRIGGWARTYRATSELKISVAIWDNEDQPWGTVRLDPVWAPEWSNFETHLRIPPGVGRLSLILEADVPTDEWVFFDELYAYPERGPASPEGD